MTNLKPDFDELTYSNSKAENLVNVNLVPAWNVENERKVNSRCVDFFRFSF